MPTPTRQLLASTYYLTDGTTTTWNFSFSGGYLDKSHIKAYTETPAGVRTLITVTVGMVVGAYQLLITPALASGDTLVIYRDTPKTEPLVNFTDESGLSELALDTIAKQSVFIGAEAFDNTAATQEAKDAASAAEVYATRAKLAATNAEVSKDATFAALTSALSLYGGAAALSSAVTSASNSAIAADISADAALISEANAAATATAAFNAGTTVYTRTLLDDANAIGARATLGAAASGANSDITSLTNLTSINGGQLGGFRNQIINGNFDVWQRNTSFVSGVAGQYGPDRWQVFRSGNAAGASFSQIVYGGNFETGSTFALRMQRNNGDTSTAFIQAATSFETIDVYKLRGKTVTLSFWSIRGANFSGTSGGVAIYYGTGTDGNMFTGFTGAVNLGSVVLNIAGFTKYSVTVVVPSNASQFGVVIGYTPIGTAGAADYMEITSIQLELGSVATPFEQRPYGMELALCRRYARYLDIGGSYVVTTSTTATLGFTFDQPMRIAPALVVGSGTWSLFSGGSFNSTGVGSLGGASTGGVSVNVSGFTGLTSQQCGVVAATPYAPLYFLNAEL